MNRAQTKLTAGTVLVCVVLPVVFQVMERGNTGGFMGYWPIYSVFLSIPLVTVAAVTVLMGRYRLWMRGRLARLLPVILAVYVPVVCLLLIVYDVGFLLVFRLAWSPVMTVPMYLPVIPC